MTPRFSVSTLIGRISVYGAACLVYFVVVGLILVTTDKSALHLTLNAFHFYGTDTFFSIATYLGDRRLIWFSGLALLCAKRYRQGAAVVVGALLTGLAIEGLKYKVFGPTPRPLVFFGDPSPLRLVPGFDNHTVYAMPSGHAALAFFFFTSIALYSQSRWKQGCFFLMALVCAFSRIYLSEHFLEDVYVGSLLGVAVALVVHGIARPRTNCNAPAQPDT